MNKPIHPIELKAAILTALGQGSRADFQAIPSDPLASRPAARALRIQMAEDNPFNQRVALLMLTRLGHSVTTVGNGREALEALEYQPFDLVLMDLQMPKMDGFEATAAIRSAEAETDRHIPIIALTAHALKEDRERCSEVGMDGFVSKPIQQDQLRQAIESCAPGSRETVKSGPPDGGSGSPLDVAAALDRVERDRAFLCEMAAMFLEGAHFP